MKLILTKLMSMLFEQYKHWYMPFMTNTGQGGGVAEFLYDTKTNRYGLKIISWRRSYDSPMNENIGLNAILETLYAMCGDKEVACAIWNWEDKAAITGYANTDEFGFKDTATFEHGFTAVMKGISIDATYIDGVTTIYFN